MIGTLLIIGIAVLGYLDFSPWIIVIATIIATFIGIHHNPAKAEMAQARRFYWKLYLSTLPLQGAVMTAFYGIGWGANSLIN
jgi:hypothetical protein